MVTIRARGTCRSKFKVHVLDFVIGIFACHGFCATDTRYFACDRISILACHILFTSHKFFMNYVRCNRILCDAILLASTETSMFVDPQSGPSKTSVFINPQSGPSKTSVFVDPQSGPDSVLLYKDAEWIVRLCFCSMLSSMV